MIRAIRGSVLVLLCVATLGCGAVKQQRAEENAPTAKVAGNWSGYAGFGANSTPVTLTMQQTGTNVTGNISIAGRPDLSGPVTGSVQGELLKLSLPTATLGEMQVKQDTITGVPAAGMPATLRRDK